MFDNGAKSIGIRGYSKGYVYAMDPNDHSQDYFTSLEKNNALDLSDTPEPVLTDDCESRAPVFMPLTYFKIENFDVHNFCILECTVIPEKKEPLVV
jgi:hypothetical protein